MADTPEDIDLLNGSDGDDAEQLTAAEVLKKLEEIWLNEKFSPELLTYHSDIVECIIDQMTAMEENIHRANKGDFRVTIYKMELQRIRFVLSSYLRSRLAKIELFTEYVLEKESKRDANDPLVLSEEEHKFAEEYVESKKAHFQLLALRHMPTNLQNLDPNKTIVLPNLDSHVFLKVNEPIPGVVIEDEYSANREEEIMDLEKGSQHIMRYSTIAKLLKSGPVSLI